MQTEHQCTTPSAILHDQSKTGEEASEHDSQTVTASEIDGSLGTTLGRGRSCCCSSSTSTQTGVDNTSCSGCSTGRDCGCGLSRRCGGDVHSCRVLSTARVLASAVTLALSVASTSSNTLDAILRANEVWESLRVFGGIGLLSVSADTVIGQSGWVAIVGISGRRCYSWQLKAEQRAGCHLGLAPRSSV